MWPAMVTDPALAEPGFGATVRATVCDPELSGVATVTHGRAEEDVVAQPEFVAATPIRTVPPLAATVRPDAGVNVQEHDPEVASDTRATNASDRASTAGCVAITGAVTGRSVELLVPTATVSPPDIRATPEAESVLLPPRKVE